MCYILGRLSFEKKKVGNFPSFGPDPPPKSCETSIFFFYSMTRKPTLQKNLTSYLDELDHSKKVVKMSKFWVDPSPPPQL